MNKIKLPSSIEYGNIMKNKVIAKEIYKTDYFFMRNKFDDILFQQPNISMFIPAVEENGEWRILEKPKQYLGALEFAVGKDYEEALQYQTALDNVIFEGFEVKDGLSICDEHSILHVFWNYEGKWKLSQDIRTLEDLTKYNLTLTPKLAKELGLI
jgi:hypothetical protein